MPQPHPPKIWQINGKAIQDLRYEAGLGQRELAEDEQVAIAPSTLCQYETGARRWPDPEVVRRLARALSKYLGREIKPEDLLMPREPAPEPAAVGT
jgi:transcriptional regulator with XRE-family HTH domain